MTSTTRFSLAALAICGLAFVPTLRYAGAADDPASAPPVSPTTSPAASLPLETMLDARGEITLDALLKDSGLDTSKLSPEARTRLQQAVTDRNDALDRANDHLAEAVRRALNVSDAQIKQSMTDEKERRRMERIRQFQPARYEALMRQKKQQAPTAQPTPQQPTQ